MAILTSEELLNRVKQYVGEDTSDAALSFVQDVTETVKATSTETEDYKKKYEENDAMWRQRYRDAFFSDKPTPVDNITEEETETKAPEHFKDLFKEVK